MAAGISRTALRRLSRLFPGVYALRTPDFEQRIAAACLWANGVASHRAAARLYELDGFDDAPPEVSVPLERNPKTNGIAVHRTDLRRAEVTRWHNIPVTRPVRT